MILRFLERRIGTDVKSDKVRGAYGRAASVIGIFANALLFALKLTVGVLSASVAITADALNNLTDASTSVVSLMGFRLANKPADEDHPYGHGRYEYLSGLMVAVMIMVIGVELMKSSVEKILHPGDIVFSWATVIALLASIAVKLWLSAINRSIGKKIGSSTLMATAQDSRNDVVATSAALGAVVLFRLTGLNLDGWMGALVAGFILVSGFGLVKDTIDPMLGAAPSKEQVDAIRAKLVSYPGVLGTHDLLVHDYGPGRQFASVHLEMDAKADPMDSHDLIDNIERDFLREQGLHLVIHYDPVATDDPRVTVMRALIEAAAKEIHKDMTIHDLRIVPGNSHTNVVFDCVVPYACDAAPKEIRARISRRVREDYPEYYCAITLEHSFVHKED